MLGHRLRRWPNIEPTICERLVFAGKHFPYPSYTNITPYMVCIGRSQVFVHHIPYNM